MTEDAPRQVEFVVEEEHAGLRLDIYLGEMLDEASRSFAQRLVKDGNVWVNGRQVAKPSKSVSEGDTVRAVLPPPPPAIPEPEDLPLDILFEDADLVIVNKAPGMVVHPAPGNYSGTLVNAVLFHCPDFQASGADLRRPGIVHRLDKDTSGVMVVAKTQAAFLHLAEQASAHSFDRRYLALLRGEFQEERGRVNAGIGRSLTDRSRMAVTSVRAKEAVTDFEVLERFGVASLVSLRLETGRTHQIRVHMRFAGRPVLGDPVYGVTDFRDWPISPELRAALDGLCGQALHAEELGITHPRTGERLIFRAPPPPDFQTALDAFRASTAGH
jgi:23S rRNA pseudouridine1911/1915/1917 synthase